MEKRSTFIVKPPPQETNGSVHFGLELINVFESVGNIRAFMQVNYAMFLKTMFLEI